MSTVQGAVRQSDWVAMGGVGGGGALRLAEVKQEKQEFKKKKLRSFSHDVPTFSHVTGQRWTVISRSAFFPFFFFNNEGGEEGGWWRLVALLLPPLRRFEISRFY